MDNIERVRRDEEEAKRKEQGEEERMRIADSEARLDLLRTRVDGKKPDSQRVEAADVGDALTSLSTSSGHINLFADFEQRAMSDAMVRSRELAVKGAKELEEKGVRLAPSAKDLKPWYVDEERAKEEEIAEERRLRDISSKMLSDPLTSIKSELSRSFPSAARTSSRHVSHPSNSTDARLQRESSERARAMELIRRKKRERERAALGMGNMTPSSVGGDDVNAGYGDVYNREETEMARQRRERGWGRPGDRGGHQDQRRERERLGGYRDRRW